jgi:hypothetical protein
MPRSENKPSIGAVKAPMGTNHDVLREIVQDLRQELVDGELTETLGASKSERIDGRINRIRVRRYAGSRLPANMGE